jgi:hypothetical protein
VLRSSRAAAGLTGMDGGVVKGLIRLEKAPHLVVFAASGDSYFINHYLYADSPSVGMLLIPQ